MERSKKLQGTYLPYDNEEKILTVPRSECIFSNTEDEYGNGRADCARGTAAESFKRPGKSGAESS